jgi:tRNA 2-thiouridine synthesizing protein A
MALFGLNKSTAPAAGPADPRKFALSDGRVIAVARRVDCLGDSCPRPQLMTKKALREAAAGEVIEVIVDNSSSMEALPPMCAGLGATHLETRKAERCWQVFIRKD